MPDIKVKVQEPTKVQTLVTPKENLKVSLENTVVLHDSGVSINEMLEGIDGTKVLFQSTYPFGSILVGVYLNGLKLCQADYSVVLPNKIQLTEPPLVGDILEIDYIK